MKKRKDKIRFGLMLLLGLFLVSFVSADICDLDVELVNQDPHPAIPGEYVELLFQVSGIENPECDGAMFHLIPSYPFSLDGMDAGRVLQGNTYISNYKTEWLIPYKLRIDKDALEGDFEIAVEYGQRGITNSDLFDISVQDSRTDFDAVVQEVVGSEVSIALANTGKYTANSIIVRIPEQDGFKVVGTDGQMVGNLDSGDYTLVSFEIMSGAQANGGDLGFDIHYTDTLGERRVVNFELPLKLMASSDNGGMVPGSNKSTAQQPDNGIDWTFWIIIVVIFGVGIVLYKKYSEQIWEFYHNLKSGKKKVSNKSSNGTPDWIKSVINKEKRK